MISKWCIKVVYDIKLEKQGDGWYQNGGRRYRKLSKWSIKVIYDIKMVEQGGICYQNGGTR
jgi:hypothetical protein